MAGESNETSEAAREHVHAELTGPRPAAAFRCEACGGPTERVPKLERKIGKPPEQPLYRCHTCEHIQVRPIPSPEQIASYYRSRPAAGAKPARVAWAGGTSRVAPSYLRRLERVMTQRRGALLDVGFGSGSFLRAAHGLEYRVTGLSLDTSRFHPDFECELREGALRRGLFPDRSFDIVGAHHVLEHVEDLTEALSAIYRFLKPGGYLLAELPHDVNSLIKRLKRAMLLRGYTKFTRLQHLRFFSVQSLRLALEGQGFEVELCRSIPGHELVRFPHAVLLMPLAPFERWTDCGHNLEAIARKPP